MELAPPHAEDMEFRANLSASLLLAHQPQQAINQLKVEQGGADADSYELQYNGACALSALGDLDGAHDHLMTAEKLCRETLVAEEMAEEEIVNELAPILVQLAYVLQLRGEDALPSLNSIIKSRPSDIASGAVAANNAISLKGNHDLFDSARKLARCAHPDVATKLTQSQRTAMLGNHALVLLQMGKYDQASTIIDELFQKKSDDEMPLLLKADLYYRQGDVGACAKIISKMSSVQSQLALTQLSLDANKLTEASDMLAGGALAPLAFHPEVVRVRVRLLEAGGNLPGAIKLLQEAITHSSNAQACAEVKRDGAMFCRRVGRQKDAIALLRMGDHHTAATKALLAEFLCASSIEDAENQLEGLPLVPEPPESFSLEQVEAGRERPQAAAAHASLLNVIVEDKGKARIEPRYGGVSVARADESGVMRVKQRRRRRRKVPAKTMNGQPDPERWLPKWQRKEQQKKKQKRLHDSKALRTGSQGSALSGTELTSTVNVPAAGGSEPRAVPVVSKRKGKKRH